jgi:hypothetical protein
MSGRYRRGFSSRRRFARSRYSGRRWGSGQARRARGNQRAANQQSDISNVNINMMKRIKVGVTAFNKSTQNDNSNPKKYECGTVALNIFELLRKSEFYQSYSNMYDQFRINRIQVKLTPVTWRTYDQFNVPSTNAGAPLLGEDYEEVELDYSPSVKKFIVPQALTVVTAWDRTGLDDTQIMDYYDNTLNNSFKVITIGDNITTYSSAKTTQLVAGANFNCVRYLYPSSQQEKSLYFSTSDLVEQIENPLEAQQWFEIKNGVNYNSKYITNLHADPNCPFKPTFLVGILSVDTVIPADTFNAQHNTEAQDAKGQIYPVTFNLEFDIGVTFRGLRKTQVV